MILSILDIKKIRKNYILFSLFLLIFMIIYESFSHEVYSSFMIYAFTIPLIFGFILSYIKKDYLNTLYNLGIITLSIGSIFQGALEIYGTTNRLVYIYLICGIILIIIGIIKSYRK